MTDRELLELAAKAAGIEIYDWFSESVPIVRSGDDGIVWRPLTDDGDALRLVSTLGIHLQFAVGFTVAYAGSVYAKQFTEHNGTDQHASTRRAIVRAAAAIGASS